MGEGYRIDGKAVRFEIVPFKGRKFRDKFPPARVIITDCGRNRKVIYGTIRHIDNYLYVYKRDFCRKRLVNTCHIFCERDMFRDYLENRDRVHWRQWLLPHKQAEHNLTAISED